MVTKEGQGKVIAQEILARKVLVVMEGNRRVMTDERDILTVVKGTKNKPPQPDAETVSS